MDMDMDMNDLYHHHKQKQQQKRSDVASALVQHVLDVVYCSRSRSDSHADGDADASSSVAAAARRLKFVLMVQRQEIVDTIVAEESGTMVFPHDIHDGDGDSDEQSGKMQQQEHGRSRSTVPPSSYFRFHLTDKETTGDDSTATAIDTSPNASSKPPTLHWMWQRRRRNHHHNHHQQQQQTGAAVGNQTDEDDDDDEEERLCLSLLAPYGGEICLSSSSTTTQMIVIVTNLQWTLEASATPLTKARTDTAANSSTNVDSYPNEVSTFWKCGTIQFVKQEPDNGTAPSSAAATETPTTSADGGVSLIECRDVTFMGTLVTMSGGETDTDGMSNSSTTNNATTATTTESSSNVGPPSYQYGPRPILQLKVVQWMTGGRDHNENTNDIHTQQSQMEDDLFGLWTTLDQMDVQLPHLMMTMTPLVPAVPSGSSQSTSSTAQLSPPRSSFVPGNAVTFESTDQTSLGDILQHYLANHLPASSSASSSDDNHDNDHAGAASSSVDPTTKSPPSLSSLTLPPTWNVVTSNLPTSFLSTNNDSSTSDTTGAAVAERSNMSTAATTSSTTSSIRQRLAERISSVRSSINVTDSVIATSALVASGTSFVTPIGAAVSVAALAAKDTVVAVAHKGKQSRLQQQQQQQQQPQNAYGGDNNDEEELLFENMPGTSDRPLAHGDSVGVAGIGGGAGGRSVSSDTSTSQSSSTRHNDDKYKFGDLTRGVVSSIREKRRQHLQQHHASNNGVELDIRPSPGHGATTSRVHHLNSSSTMSSSSSRNGSTNSSTASYLKENEGRFVGVMGASAGAGVGLLVAGPIGAIAGSVAGSIGSQAALRRQREQQQQQQGSISRSIGSTNDGETTSSVSSFRIGDSIRSLVAKGKDATSSVRTNTEGLTSDDQPDNNTTSTTSLLKSKASLLGANLRGAVSRGKAAADVVVAEGKTASGREADSTYRFCDFSRGLIQSYKKNVGGSTPSVVAVQQTSGHSTQASHISLPSAAITHEDGPDSANPPSTTAAVPDEKSPCHES